MQKLKNVVVFRVGGMISEADVGALNWTRIINFSKNDGNSLIGETYSFISFCGNPSNKKTFLIGTRFSCRDLTSIRTSIVVTPVMRTPSNMDTKIMVLHYTPLSISVIPTLTFKLNITIFAASGIWLHKLPLYACKSCQCWISHKYVFTKLVEPNCESLRCSGTNTYLCVHKYVTTASMFFYFSFHFYMLIYLY